MAALLTATFSQRAAAADDYDPSGRVARLSYLRGSVSFQPAGESDWVSAVANRPMTTADRLWADDDGRAEIQLGSATVRLDSLTGLSFLNLDDRTTQIELSVGTIYIRVLRLGRDESFEIDTPNQAFSILRPGQYRIEASEDGNSTMVTVRAGEGEAIGSSRTYHVGPGESGRFTGTVSLRASIFRAAGYDEFDRWCEDRNRRDDRSRSVRYVSPDVVGYQDLDDYGVWYSDSDYGYIWVPRVAQGWAPYQYGHWVWISPWGWTWVDEAPWGYAPFHYGRWAYVRNRWGWVPGPIAVRPVYAPALVAFVGGPRFSVSVAVGGGGGYVGWFPLGPREVYVPAYRTSREYVNRVNISNTTVTNITITNVYDNSNNRNIRYANKTAPGGVTTVAHGTFVNAQPVRRAVVAVNEREIGSAPVSRRAEVVPTRSSVLGASAQSDRRVARPSAEIANRSVVAKTLPPPPPVPFERQRQKLEAQPGQPLARSEIDGLRPANASPRRGNVTQAPAGGASQADSNQPESQAPSGPPARADRPDGANRGRPASAPISNPAPDVDRNPRAEDAPPPRPDRPSGSNRERPASAPISNPAPDVDRKPRAEDAPPPRADRPRGANRERSGSAPPSNPAPPDVERNPRTEDAPPPRADRPSGANRGRSGGAPPSNPAPPDVERNPRTEDAPPPRADRPSGANRGRSANAPPSDAAPHVDRNPRAQEAPTPRADQPSASQRREPAAKPAGSPEASTPAEAKRRQKEPPPEQGADEKTQKKQN